MKEDQNELCQGIETNVNSCLTSISFQRDSSLAEKKLNGMATRAHYPNYLQQV